MKICNKMPDPSKLHLLGAGVLYVQDRLRGRNRQSPNPDLRGERAGAGKKREPQAAMGGVEQQPSAWEFTSDGAGLESSLCHLRAVWLQAMWLSPLSLSSLGTWRGLSTILAIYLA